MLTVFVVLLLLIAALELIKGLSANGTPPVLQRFSWQMDLAYFMWSTIGAMRVVAGLAIAGSALLVPAADRLSMVLWAVPLLALWLGVYWLFNRWWVGRIKFPLITQKTFVGAAENKVDLGLQIIGVVVDGEAKAFPANMVYWHHQIPDTVGNKPLWITYCGLCQSGRVYDTVVDGRPLTLTLVGAVSFNATFRDSETGTWWRQETGEAAKGPLKGRVLEDYPCEQMTLGNWLTKYPESLVLQYDPTFTHRYEFFGKLLNYEASKPAWHMVGSPPLVIGVDLGEHARAYDWSQLQGRGLVQDQVGDHALLVLVDPDQTSGFVYDRRHGAEILQFERTEAGIRDLGTGSMWNHFGQCTEGALKGQQLTLVQSYQQFVRSWITFHGNTTFYEF